MVSNTFTCGKYRLISILKETTLLVIGVDGCSEEISEKIEEDIQTMRKVAF